ncbi:MAG: hypothetical protein H7837_04440 [Magnetococcus sp. MYC-9]
MKEILSRLESILDRLTEPERLTAEEVGVLAQEWDVHLALLDAFPEGDIYRRLPAGERLYLRVWLQRIQERLPAVQELLTAHKSELAQQLFSENRRFRAINSRYSADTWSGATLHQGA